MDCMGLMGARTTAAHVLQVTIIEAHDAIGMDASSVDVAGARMDAVSVQTWMCAKRAR